MDTRTEAETIELKFLKMMDHLTNSTSRAQNTSGYDTHSWNDTMYKLEDGCCTLEDLLKDIQQDREENKEATKIAKLTLTSMIKLLTSLGLQIEAQEGRMDPRKKLLMIFGRLEVVGKELQEVERLASVDEGGEGTSDKASAEAK